MVELGTNQNLGQEEEATFFHFFMIEKWWYHETLWGQTQGPGINIKFHLICWRVIQRGFPSKWWALHSFQMTHRIAINGAFHIILPLVDPMAIFQASNKLRRVLGSTHLHPNPPRYEFPQSLDHPALDHPMICWLCVLQAHRTSVDNDMLVVEGVNP